MKKYKNPFLFLAFLILLGSGCGGQSVDSPTQNSLPDDKIEGIEEVVVDQDRDNQNVVSFDISLEVEPLGAGMARIAWEVDDENMVRDDGFVVVRGSEPDPEHDGVNFWWRHHRDSRGGIWVDIPEGFQNFRVCILEDGECSFYSRNVGVEIR